MGFYKNLIMIKNLFNVHKEYTDYGYSHFYCNKIITNLELFNHSTFIMIILIMHLLSKKVKGPFYKLSLWCALYVDRCSSVHGKVRMMDVPRWWSLPLHYFPFFSMWRLVYFYLNKKVQSCCTHAFCPTAYKHLKIMDT